MNLGRRCGLHGGQLLYAIRFLNIFFGAGLVWIGFVAARLLFENRPLPRLALPALLALWPQSSFYSIQSDSLSPLCFGIVFVGMAKLFREERPGIWLGAWTGLALAASCIVKTINLPLVIVVGVAVLCRIWQLARTGKSRPTLLASGALILCTAAPITGWMIRNYQTFGDLTATHAKTELLGWTRKPMADWWSHPIFTLHGIHQFCAELFASFWRGEFIWHGEAMTSPATDAFYWMATVVVVIFTVWSALRPGAEDLKNGRWQILCLASASFISLIVFLLLLSITFDFGSCVYPSRDNPYFTSGRLLSAAAVPFFCLAFMSSTG